MSSAKAILIKRLSGLLGFQDGASDVLEHLLTIESRKDLLDYLSQLLGTDNEKVQNFVSDIGRFQRGESVMADEDDDNDGTDQQEQQPERSIPKSSTAVATATKPPPPLTSSKKATSVAASKKTGHSPPKSQNSNQSRPSGGSNINSSNLVPLQKKESKSNSTNSNKNGKSSSPTPPASQASKTPPPPTQAAASASTAIVVPAAVPRPPPKKGKAKVECGCFGYLHKPLTNCLFCGRVSCEREGYDFCNFCGYQVQPPPAQGSVVQQHDAAWIHKEKLLRYDRESAQRTRVLDDQADYFSNAASERFMSQQERDESRAKEEERTRNKHQRQKMQLSLAL